MKATHYRIIRPGNSSMEYLTENGTWTTKSADAKNYYLPRERVLEIAQKVGGNSGRPRSPLTPRWRFGSVPV